VLLTALLLLHPRISEYPAIQVMKDMNGPSVRGSVFDGTLQEWPTTAGPTFDGPGIGPDSRLKVFPFQQAGDNLDLTKPYDYQFVPFPDEYDYSHSVSYDYSADTAPTLHFKDPPVYGSNVFTACTISTDGSKGTFNSNLSFDSVTADYNFKLIGGSPGVSPTYFKVDPDLSIKSIVIGTDTYDWAGEVLLVKDSIANLAIPYQVSSSGS